VTALVAGRADAGTLIAVPGSTSNTAATRDLAEVSKLTPVASAVGNSAIVGARASVANVGGAGVREVAGFSKDLWVAGAEVGQRDPIDVSAVAILAGI
jgi:hypothetical protein